LAGLGFCGLGKPSGAMDNRGLAAGTYLPFREEETISLTGADGDS